MIRLVRCNLEHEYIADMITHNGFVIKPDEEFGPIDANKLIHGNQYMDTEFRCECGAFMGQDIIGQKCPVCGTEISLHSLNFGYTGWIDLKKHKVITPVYYEMLKRVLSANVLKFILGDYKADYSVQYNENDTEFEKNKKQKKSGRVAANDINAIIKNIPKSKHIYMGLGHDKFYENFEDIIMHCARSGTDEERDILIENKESVFTSKIPVYSTAFRPVSETSETKFYPKIDKFFAMIAVDANNIDNMFLDIEKIQCLNNIQNKLNEAAKHLIQNEIAKKNGFVRSEICGGTFSFSARGVITLDISLRADEVDLPYNMMVIAYQYKITHILATRYHMTLEQAYLFVSKTPKDPVIVSIMDEIIREVPWIFILREPTNNLASIELCKIRNYKMGDDTISLPPEPLPGFNADFDGDALNIGFLPPEIVPSFEAFHLSCLTNYITEKVTVDLLSWSSIALGKISL
ncbi:MAG: hypothetical protein IKU29_02935 [Parabacteroides sp.]|nr:hypothetical protein [Parabacteroides sp.]